MPNSLANNNRPTDRDDGPPFTCSLSHHDYYFTTSIFAPTLPLHPPSCLICSWLQLSQYDWYQDRISLSGLYWPSALPWFKSTATAWKASVRFSRIMIPNCWHLRFSPSSQCSHSACTISLSMLLTTRNATSRSCRCNPIR